MKRLILVLGSLALMACGGDSSTAVQMGTVSFKVDALTCVGTSSINFFLDGSVIGNQTLSAGQSSSQFPVRAGSHTAGAQETVSPGFTWPTQNITVPVNTNLSVVLTC